MMNSDDEVLRTALQQAQQQADGPAPDFETVFGAAERQSRDRRRSRFRGLAAAAVIAGLGLALLPTQEQEFTYVDVEALMATTYWSAPSDSLLPEHQFDIYREIPSLFESTGLEEGALL